MRMEQALSANRTKIMTAQTLRNIHQMINHVILSLYGQRIVKISRDIGDFLIMTQQVSIFSNDSFITNYS